MERMKKASPLRPDTVRLLSQMVKPLTATGVVTCYEFETIFSHLNYLAKHGENKPDFLPKLITPQEVAELLAISYSQFRTLEKEGAFTFKRRLVGKKNVRYLQADVYNYMLADS